MPSEWVAGLSAATNQSLTKAAATPVEPSTATVTASVHRGGSGDGRSELAAELLGGGADEPGEEPDRDCGDHERDDGRGVGVVDGAGRGDERGGQAELDRVAASYAHIIGSMTGDELREVMRRFPAPVAVVTTQLDGERFGLTVGSLVSLSLTPPLVGISIGKDSSSHEPIRRAEGWAASLLAADQAAIAQHFARSGIPPVALWIGVDVRDGGSGPIVQGELA